MPTCDGEKLAAGTTQSPVPPPPLTPTGTASSTHCHRRHRTISSSSSSSSSLSTVSSAASSPSPSPRGRGTTSNTSNSTTSVPFSWEHHPGIPKTRLIPAGTPSSAPTPLPLPPPLRAPTTSSSRPRHHHHQHVRRRRARGKPPPADDAADPFAAALAECTRDRERGDGAAGSESDDAGLMDALFPARAPPAPTCRRWSSIASAGGGVIGLLDLYGCKSAMGGVAEGAFVVRRPAVAVVRAVPAGRAGPGRAGRR